MTCQAKPRECGCRQVIWGNGVRRRRSPESRVFRRSAGLGGLGCLRLGYTGYGAWTGFCFNAFLRLGKSSFEWGKHVYVFWQREKDKLRARDRTSVRPIDRCYSISKPYTHTLPDFLLPSVKYPSSNLTHPRVILVPDLRNHSLTKPILPPEISRTVLTPVRLYVTFRQH